MARVANRGLALLLATAAASALAGPAFAAASEDARDARIRQLEQAVRTLMDEVQALKASQAEAKAAEADAAAASAAAKEAVENVQAVGDQMAALKQSAADQYADVQNQRAQDVRVTLANGRPAFASADGRFQAQLRALMQYDAAYYAQGRPAAVPDLSSGTNFRRARFGIEGRVFGEWLYGFIYDFGATGTEQRGNISDSYVQYEGWAPFHFKLGSFAPNAGLEDQGTGDLLFLERAAPADLARSVAAADGRQNYLNVFTNTNDYFASLSWTGAKSADPISFDEQQALVGRFAYRVLQDMDQQSNTNVVLSANATYVFKVADIAASPAGASPLTLQSGPESGVDATRLISTGAINADDYVQWGLEAGANSNNVYVQGGYFSYAIGRRDSVLSDPHFNGWYVQGSYILTGESRRYNPATASWAGPAPAAPFALDGTGLGAWELAARYSVLDLDYRAGVAGSAAPAGGIRGGDQKGWTLGINWYPNLNVRFEFDYQNLRVKRLSAAAPFGATGQDVDIFSSRAQVAF